MTRKTFWQKLPKPFFALAPMANVTDFAFRQMFAKYGKPDILWTEFVSADGLLSAGYKKLLIDLKFSPKERPIVAQLFTGKTKVMEKAVAKLVKMGFDGIDINMGCPDRAVEKQGGGASLTKDPKKAIALIEAARLGAGKVPVSVKTRLGYNKIDLEWIRALLETHLPALTIHMRTRKEMSDVPAHWEMMPEIIKMRDRISPETLIIGNGDIVSVRQGAYIARESGCDGIMVGRGAFGKPWFFRDVNKYRKGFGDDVGDVNVPLSLMSDRANNSVMLSAMKTEGNVLSRPTIGLAGNGKIPGEAVFSRRAPYCKSDILGKPASEEGLESTFPSVFLDRDEINTRLKIMLEHARLFVRTFKGKKNFEVMRKHFKAYVNGWDGAKELRTMLMGTRDIEEVKGIVKKWVSQRT